MSEQQVNFLPRRIFDLIYGPSGSAKSSYFKRIIEYLYERTGKKARVWIGDGSYTTYEDLIDAGVAEVGEFGFREWPQDVLMNRLAVGYGLKDPLDPQSDLIQTSAQDLKDKYSITILEGVSTASRYVMGHVKGGLAWRAARGEKIGPESAIRIVEGDFDANGKLISGPGTAFGGAGQAHYGQTQSIMIDMVNQFKCLPHHVMMSAHEYVNDPEKDDLVNERLAGPEVGGKKLTGSFQKLFANTLHSVVLGFKENKQVEGKRVSELSSDWRLYTRSHYITEGNYKLQYKAMTRDVDETFPIYFENGNPGDAILDYYQKLREFKTSHNKFLKQVDNK